MHAFRNHWQAIIRDKAFREKTLENMKGNNFEENEKKLARKRRTWRMLFLRSLRLYGLKAKPKRILQRVLLPKGAVRPLKGQKDLIDQPLDLQTHTCPGGEC